MPAPDPSAPAISTRDLRVDYADLTAVQDVQLTIPRGEVFGLIGPNGAGKTSIIRVLATLLRPTYGDVSVAGIDALEHADEVHKIVGYMPDLAPVYDELKVWEFLDLFGAAHFVQKLKRRERIDELLHAVDLFAKRETKAGGLSRGMKQRLCLAKTLIAEPHVMLLDEPFSGIDPMGRIQLRELIVKLGREGRTLLVSSHILTEMSEFCTSIGIMEKGRLVLSGRVDEIIAKMRSHTQVVVELLEPHESYLERVRAMPSVLMVAGTDHRLEVDVAGEAQDAAELLRAMVNGGVPVRAFYERKLNVEDILLKVGAREVS